MSGMFDLGRIKLQICVNNDRGSKKIPRAIMEKWGQLCFGKLHSDSRSLPSLLYSDLVDNRGDLALMYNLPNCLHKSNKPKSFFL